MNPIQQRRKPTQSGSSTGASIEPGPARRPITNMPGEPLNEEPLGEHSGLNPITPVLPEPEAVLEDLQEEARQENDRILLDGTDGDRYKLIQRTVVDEISRAQTWAKVRCPAQTKDKIVLGIVEEMEDGQTFNYIELRERVKSDVDKAYHSSRARQLPTVISDKPYFSGRPRHAAPDDHDDIDMAGPWNMLPRWKRHGGSDGGTYGNDPNIVQNSLDEYEQQGMPSPNVPTLEKTRDNDTRGDLPLETTGLESLDWIDETHTVQLKYPSPLGPANHRILKRAIQIIEERTFEAEKAGKRADQLKKPLGTQGLQQALALELKIPVRDIETAGAASGDIHGPRFSFRLNEAETNFYPPGNQ
jgi:hypothetical protein